MIFHRSRIKPNVINKVVIDNHQLTQVNSAKYLGVIIDHKLNWIEHISYVKSKMSKGIGIMYKARQFLTKNALFMLYHAYIYPYMTYCIEVWGCASQTQLNCLLLLQKKFIRIMSFSPQQTVSKKISSNLIENKSTLLRSLFSTYQSTFPFNGSSSFNENVFV